MHDTFRPRSNYFWAGISFMLIILFATNSALVVTNKAQTFFEFSVCLILAGFTYLLWIKPKLVLRDDFIEVVNPLRTEFIPYAEVEELETKWALTIIHSGGKTRVWVAPASGKQKWIAEKRLNFLGRGVPFSDSASVGTESVSASLDSHSGQAAYLIRERIRRLH